MAAWEINFFENKSTEFKILDVSVLPFKVAPTHDNVGMYLYNNFDEEEKEKEIPKPIRPPSVKRPVKIVSYNQSNTLTLMPSYSIESIPTMK